MDRLFMEEGETFPISDAERGEMEWLCQLGFYDWSNFNFEQFLKGLESSGAADIKKIQTFIPSKTEAEVEKYCEVFWDRYHELKDENVKKFVAKIAPKLNEVKENAPEIIIKHSKFSQEADLFLLRRVHELYQEPKPDTNKRWWIFMKVLEEMKIHEVFKKFVKDKDHLILFENFEALLNMVESTWRHIEASEPKTALQSNSQLI